MNDNLLLVDSSTVIQIAEPLPSEPHVNPGPMACTVEVFLQAAGQCPTSMYAMVEITGPDRLSFQMSMNEFAKDIEAGRIKIINS